MLNPAFIPHVVVHHHRRTPHPILPVSYSFFLVVALQDGVADLTVPEQLTVVKMATARRRAYAFPGPFGPVIAFEYRVSKQRSVFLNSEGEFA